jgi:DNA-directed DNA polymerase III PolC
MLLNCKTYFSFRYGTFSTEALVQAAVQNKEQHLAIANINNTCDAWDFVDDCNKNNIKPIIGVEIKNEDETCYILLAKNNKGIHDINYFLSIHLQSKKKFPVKFANNENVIVIYPIATWQKNMANLPLALLSINEYIGVQMHEVNKLFSVPVQSFEHKFVAHHKISFAGKLHFNAHRLLRAIDKNILLSKQLPSHIGAATEVFVTKNMVAKAYEAHQYLLQNAHKIIEACNIAIQFNTDKNKKAFTNNKKNDVAQLKALALKGMHKRYGNNNTEALFRVTKELKIIDELGFNAYFLIAWDIIEYAQSKGFFYVGRGSGANSIVAYCLQITDVDPIELDLYFERFLNPHRTSPPDFDIDFSWKDRDEIIAYTFNKYGKDYVSLLGMYSTFQHNATVRELGKVFGLPKHEIDDLLSTKTHSFKEDSIQHLIFKYGAIINNFPNHQSIHPGGILISELPIYNYATLDMPPEGFATAQLDMFVAEKVGLYKLDILSQRGLGHIKDATLLVKQNKNIDIDIRDVQRFKTDPKVAAQIRAADTIGCFYIESPAMRQLLKKLKCDDYITLVAASSIIRPGVSQSGMMKQYIERFHDPENINYLHPVMKTLLQETYGVMVYQEDVIKVAHHFAGLDLGEADILRRAMSGKYRGSKEMMRIKATFFENCNKKNYDINTTTEIWRQIESFGGYSFSKAHSASFAVESYQSLYLKTYFPMEFMVAVINNFGGFYSTELYFNELRKTGAQVQAPCVNNSDKLTNITGVTVYVGFCHIQSISDDVIQKIISIRNISGTYLHLQDFIVRTNITGEQLNILIKINAFRFTNVQKKELLWQANFLVTKHTPKLKQATQLFDNNASETLNLNALPPLHQTLKEDMIDEMALLGFTIKSPFAIVNANHNDYLLAKDLQNNYGKIITVLGYYITQKNIRTQKGDRMYFGTFIDAENNWIDTVHFPNIPQQAQLNGRGFYIITGKVIQEFGVYGIEVFKCEKIGVR